MTNEQKNFFEAFGYLVFKNYLSPFEMKQISDQFDDSLTADRQGNSFSGDKRQTVLGVTENNPALVALLEDDRFYEPMEQLLGENFTWLVSDSTLYVGDTGWHPDNGTSYQKIKYAIYLDPVRKDTGCLRVIPGSHLDCYQDAVRKVMSDNHHGRSQQEIPSVALESDPGDVVMFNQRLWHSSVGGKTGRRMMAMSFAENPVAPEQIDEFIGNYRRLSAYRSTTQTDRVFADSFLYSDKPRIKSLAAKLVEYQLL